MLKMIKGKDTVIIDKGDNEYKVLSTAYRNGKPIYDGYETTDNLMSIIDFFEDEGYARFEIPEEWSYKFIRMC